jgi:FAD/FMN-containing dehydrogenase
VFTRRELIVRGAQVGALALLPSGCLWRRTAPPEGAWLNDVHSQINRTHVLEVVRPRDVEELQALVSRAAHEGQALSLFGGRHAMGGQQFGSETIAIDTGGLAKIGPLDAANGTIEVGAGVQWPELIAWLQAAQGEPDAPGWAIVQKQTGADRLSLGGALSANAHGRGLHFAPIVQDVEQFTLLDAQGRLRRCSRDENAEWFQHAIGGYGLFGVITSVKLRLMPRGKLERVVELVDSTNVAERIEGRIADSFTYGDFQYSTDIGGDTFLRRGVLSCYRPVAMDTPIRSDQKELQSSDWLKLIALAHLDRGRLFRTYSEYYLSTNGQVYRSETNQSADYIDDYHHVLRAQLGAMAEGSEMISELYVPRPALHAFLEAVRADMIQYQANPIYGTVRWIQRDDLTALAWAREPWACVIVNLHTAHDPAALAVTAGHFQRLIARARELGGSYYLTYHHWATPDQVVACHPHFAEFLHAKKRLDPDERFQSDWYRFYRDELGTAAATREAYAVR